ncbi:ubiquitin domain protein [Aspergillus ochraceoroseus]|uniref:Ubiquitin domain protein n=1 Tax=Aspergillus ochraceoroseus TaxID=138278 RepID=A0A0F8WHM0_9EURO|nr:ubiquitin domain protein [Aspergillus ochraceoroseus]
MPSAATHNLPLGEHFNAPIRCHIWRSKRRRWTRALLDQERKEFFETRVTGRPEVWTALSVALSFMRVGDLVTAQSIIDAAGITVPTGDLCQGCYDEQGALYRLPQCIVSDPENIARSLRLTMTDDHDDDDDVDVGFETDDGKLSLNEASGDELIADDVERERRRDEKGKTSERDLILVKARLSDRGGPDIVISVAKSQNVGFIARKVQQEAGISRMHRVRIAYLGKILKEQTPLVDQGWKPGHVVNALVATRPLSS